MLLIVEFMKYKFFKKIFGLGDGNITFLSFCERPHLFLKNKFKIYSTWHKNSYSDVVHGALLVAFIVLVAIISLFSIGLLPISAAVVNYYVDPSGTDDSSHGLGTGTDAFNTIQYAIDFAGSNSIINIAPGTYTERISINKSLSLVGASKDTTNIVGVTGYDSVIAVSSTGSEGSPLLIKNLTIDANNNPFGADTWESGIYADASNYIKVENVNVINFKADGILLSNDSNNNTVKKSTITGSTDGCIAGVNIDGNSGENLIGGYDISDGNTISVQTAGIGNLNVVYLSGTNDKSNTIQHNTLNGGVQAFQQDSFSTGQTTVADNVRDSVASPTHGGIRFDGGNGIILRNTIRSSSQPIEFFGNNTFIEANHLDGATSHAIYLGAYTGTATIDYNTIYDINGGDAIRAVSGGTYLKIDDNTIYNISGAGIYLEAGAKNADIRSNDIHDIAETGYAAVVVYGEGATIYDNMIHHNQSGGLAVYAQTTKVESNRFLDGAWGIILGAVGANFDIRSNSFEGNDPGSLTAHRNLSLTAGSATAMYNWWGSADLETIQQGVTDGVTILPYYTNASATALASAKAITAFSIPGQVGLTVLNEGNHTIKVTMPSGTDVTNLSPVVTYSVAATVSPDSLVPTNFTSPVTYRVTSADLVTVQDYLVTIIVLSSSQNSPDVDGSITLNSTAPQGLIVNPTQPLNVTVSSGTINPSLDVSEFIGSDGTGTLPSITILSLNADNTEITIPASTIVTSASTTWDGVMSVPTNVTNITLPETSGQTKTLVSAIEFGFSGAKLSFDKSVKILFPGQADKRVGYLRTGESFTEIVDSCVSVSDQVAINADLVGSKEDCKINSGADLVVWTKHFTTFAVYTQTQQVTQIISGGGGAVVIVPSTRTTLPIVNPNTITTTAPTVGVAVQIPEESSVQIPVTTTVTSSITAGTVTTTPSLVENIASLGTKLFDIIFTLQNALLNKSSSLVAMTQFTSFGTVPTSVLMKYQIVDSKNVPVYSSKESVTVETERLVTKKFENLNLPNGKYTLVLSTSYGNNVNDEFKQVFEVKGASTSWSVWIGLTLLFVGIFCLIFSIFVKRKA